MLILFLPAKYPQLLDLIAGKEQRGIYKGFEQPFKTTGQQYQRFDQQCRNAHLYQPQDEIACSGGCHTLPGLEDLPVEIVVKQARTDPGDNRGDLNIIDQGKRSFRSVLSQQPHHQDKDQIVQDGRAERRDTKLEKDLIDLEGVHDRIEM